MNRKIIFYRFVFVLISVFIMFLFGCSEDGPTTYIPNPQVIEIYETILQPQELNAKLFEDLTTSMDTLAAMDSVLKVFLQDTLVEWGEVDEQGIAIQYKNGIRGGIFIDPLDSPDSSGFVFKGLNKENLNPTNYQNIIPGSKKTIFLNPSYWERKKYADILINNYNNNLPKVDFEKPVIYKNEEVTIDQLTKLSNYGIIHIYSHGWAWPKSTNIVEIYLLTGETWSDETVDNYIAELFGGDVTIVYTFNDKKNHFLVSPKFIATYNNFSNNSSLIYGGFCYSYLGDWPEIMINTAGAGGYFGFDWSVYTNRNAKWNYELIKNLTDENNLSGNTTGDWINNDMEKYYWSKKQNRYVSIEYYGYTDLALIEKDESVPDFNRCGVQVDFGGRYSYTTPDDAYDREDERYTISVWEKYPGSFSGNTFTATFNKTIGTLAMSGSINATFNNDYTTITNISWTENRNNSTTTFVGTDIPLDTNEWGTIYQVKMDETCDHITTLTDVANNAGGLSWTLPNYWCNGDSKIWISFSKE